jgi:FkbM family methyltransferase
MNLKTIAITAKLIRLTKNPWSIVLDRLGRHKVSYLLHLRNGLVFEMRPDRGDHDSFREIWLNEDYTAFGQILAPGDTVIDVGANVGCFTLLASRRVGPNGRVIALEPDPDTYRQLCKNLALSKVENVVAMQAAMAAEPGEALLFSEANCRYSSLYANVDQRVAEAPGTTVTTNTLDRIMEAEGVERCNYLKLDCEGAEHDIVRALSTETASRIDQITMELHEVDGVDSGATFGRLGELGFEAVGREAIHYFRRPED